MATYGHYSDSAMLVAVGAASQRYLATISSGPNMGLTFYSSQPPLRDSSIAYLHPALLGGGGDPNATAWYNQQNGNRYALIDTTTHPPNSVFFFACGPSGVAALAHQVQVHEGILAPADTESSHSSHFAQVNHLLTSLHLASTVEGTVVKGDTAALRTKVIPRIKTFDSLAAIAQNARNRSTAYSGVWAAYPRSA